MWIRLLISLFLIVQVYSVIINIGPPPKPLCQHKSKPYSDAETPVVIFIGPPPKPRCQSNESKPFDVESYLAGILDRPPISDISLTAEPISRHDFTKLEKVTSQLCKSNKEYEDLVSEVEKYKDDVSPDFGFIIPAQEGIIIEELRRVLRFESLGELERNNTNPEDHEIESASTIKEYYRLREQRVLSELREDNDLNEKDLKHGIMLLEKHFPNIRPSYKQSMEVICLPYVEMDRKGIDALIDHAHGLTSTARMEIFQMNMRKATCPSVKMLVGVTSMFGMFG